jgi:peptide/nickel transport system permease protein
MIPYKYILFRIIAIFPVVVGAVTLMFIIMRLIPADPVLMLIDPAHRTPEVIASMRKAMGLDQPLYVQYFSYLFNVFRGDLGYSWHSGHTVTEELIMRFPATLELVTISLIVCVLVGIPLGILAGWRRGKMADHFASGITLAGLSLPPFWWGIILIILFYFFIPLCPAPLGRISIGVNPPTHITGLYLLDSLLTGNTVVFVDSFRHLILPVAALAFFNLALLTKLQRSEIAEALESDYIKTARAKGASETTVLFKHALKNALLPTITEIGLIFGGLIGGEVVVEQVFSWPGMGRYAVDCIQFVDYAGLQGFIIVVVLTFTVVNLITDLLYAFIDPRIKQ